MEDQALASSAGIIVWVQSHVYMLSWRRNAHVTKQKHMYWKELKGHASLPTSRFCLAQYPLPSPEQFTLI